MQSDKYLCLPNIIFIMVLENAGGPYHPALGIAADTGPAPKACRRISG